MKAVEGRIGRVFVLRLEHDDPIPRCIEEFAARKGIRLAQVLFHGGIHRGNLVSGPVETSAPKPVPMVIPISEAHESSAIGFLAPTEEGDPILHMHGNLGRAGGSVSGCFQKGLNVWLVGEAVICEIISNASVERAEDAASGLKLLSVPEEPATL